jgi:hypothetical protein
MKNLIAYTLCYFALYSVRLLGADRREVVVGTPVTMKVTAEGAQPMTYQWKKNGGDIPGATSDTYRIAALTKGDAGTYTVQVTNASGSVRSDEGVLFLPPPPTKVTVLFVVETLTPAPTN